MTFLKKWPLQSVLTLLLLLFLIGCESGGDSDDEEPVPESVTTTTDKAVTPANTPTATPSAAHEQYYGYWSGGSSFDYQGTNYTATVAEFRFWKSDYAESLAVIINFYNSISREQLGLGQVNSLQRWISDNVMQSIIDGGTNALIIDVYTTFSSPTTATINMPDYLGGCSINITKN